MSTGGGAVRRSAWPWCISPSSAHRGPSAASLAGFSSQPSGMRPSLSAASRPRCCAAWAPRRWSHRRSGRPWPGSPASRSAGRSARTDGSSARAVRSVSASRKVQIVLASGTGRRGPARESASRRAGRLIELGALVDETVLRLQDQHLEHEHWSKAAASFGPSARAPPAESGRNSRSRRSRSAVRIVALGREVS